MSKVASLDSSPDIEITELDAAAVDQVKGLWGQLLEHHQTVATQLAGLGRPLTLAASWAIRRDQYLGWFTEAQGRLWVATLDGAPVGYCFVHTGDGSGSWDWGLQTGVLETLVVSSQARGFGLGTRLYQIAQQHFAQAGIGIWKVSVIAGNDDAIRLYRRLGALDQLLTLVMPVQPDQRDTKPERDTNLKEGLS